MKLISFVHAGRASFGAVLGDRVLDLGPLFAGRASDLKALLTADLLPAAAEATEAAKWGTSANPTLALSSLTLLPVIPNPGKIVCVGLNYGEHVRETGREVTEAPTLFLRVANSQVGHGQPIVLPPESSQLDYEGEIAVVIGRAGRRISEADSWQHIAGYSCYNDASVRDWQRATSQWTPGKNFDRTGAFGPWLVTADEIEAGRNMSLVTRLNGREMQRATVDMMIHGIPRQIAYISTFTTLEAGDVIVTGTPGGVGARRDPPIFMQPGDVVEIEVDAVGVLSNTIVAEVAA